MAVAKTKAAPAAETKVEPKAQENAAEKAAGKANGVQPKPTQARVESRVKSVGELLREPFAIDEVKFKPQVTNADKTRCLPICYIDARLVMDRLDEVVGVEGWKDEYEILPNGKNVRCTLSLKIDGDWVGKSDVGGESEQPDAGDRCKASFSDALKRTAVKFGIGRYLYRIKLDWVGFDAKTRKITQAPRMPAWALPGAKEKPTEAYHDPVEDAVDGQGSANPGATQAAPSNAQPAANQAPEPTRKEFVDCRAALASADTMEKLERYKRAMDDTTRRQWSSQEMEILLTAYRASYFRLDAAAKAAASR